MKKERIVCAVSVIVLLISVFGSGFVIHKTKQELALAEQTQVEQQEEAKKKL